MTEDTYARVSSKIETEWYPFHEDEWFTQTDICVYFDWREAKTRQSVSRKLYHDSSEMAEPRLEKRNKTFRIIDRTLEEINWQEADEKAVLALRLPFRLHEYVKFFPKSVIVIAGESNAGKTAWMYNFVLLNMYDFKVTLYNSETSREQMKERMLNFDVDIPTPPPFRTVERYDNFADVIDPDGVSVIDYVDCDGEFYNNGIEISRVFKKLKNGVAVIGLQKKSDTKNFKGQIIRTKLGYGGDTTIKRASLYIALGKGHLEIVKAKSWANPTINPNGKAFTFQLVKGAKFVNIQLDSEF